MYKQSLEDPDEFWGSNARSTLKWFRDFDRVSQGGFETGDVAWFTGGQLNGCYNCIDQHLPHRANQVFVLLRDFEVSIVEVVVADDGHMKTWLVHAAHPDFRNGAAQGTRNGTIILIFP